MKKCAYCGRENPEDADRCGECGTSGFIAWEKVNVPKHWVFRFTMAACMGLAVLALAVIVSWHNTRDADGLRRQQYFTQYSLAVADKAVADYRQKFGVPPRDLKQLNEEAEHGSLLETTSHEILDGWKRPFIYWTNGNEYLIASYGRDGKPGGEGLDSDLTNKSREPSSSRLTFPQFVRDCPSGGILSTCVFCGILTFLLGLFTIKEPDMTLTMGLKILATLVGAVMAAAFLAVLHIPTGH